MKAIFSARTRGTTWRQLWTWLAEAEKELGIDISDEAIAQMRANLVMTDESFKVAADEERKRRHDVMGMSSKLHNISEHVFSFQTFYFTSYFTDLGPETLLTLTSTCSRLWSSCSCCRWYHPLWCYLLLLYRQCRSHLHQGCA